MRKFEEKLSELNQKMRQVKAEEDRDHEGNLKGRSHKSTRSKTAEYKKEARMLYSQYNDVTL